MKPQSAAEQTDSLEGFSPSQRRIITDRSPVKQVIAGAGSGKTKTVIGLVDYRLKAGLETPGRVLLLSFSRKAVMELRSRLDPALHHAVEISTFHSFCYRHLLRLDPDFAGAARIQILMDEEKNAILGELLRKHEDAIAGIPFPLLLSRPAMFRRLFPAVAMEVYRAFHQAKRERCLFEFEDLILRVLVALREQRPWIRDLFSRYDLIIVDEFQDTDMRQLEFLRLMRPPRLVVVGDDWQAIYAFRGATVEPFLRFRKYFPGAQRFYLADNYRSIPSIVKTGQKVIRGSSDRISKRVRSKRRGTAEVLGLPLHPGSEEALAALLIGSHADYRVLCRSNFRVRRWVGAGIPADRVLTIHKAKGLEFPVVFLDLMGGWNGSDEKTRQTQDEEVRILYVGVTRAMNRLVCLCRPRYGEEEPEGRLWELLSGVVQETSLERLHSRL